MKKIEIMRALGYSISLDEEAFRKKLENLYMELNKPTQYKGRLNELTSLVRMQVFFIVALCIDA
jgi:nuclear pore complex protein Nup54